MNEGVYSTKDLKSEKLTLIYHPSSVVELLYCCTSRFNYNSTILNKKKMFREERKL